MAGSSKENIRVTSEAELSLNKRRVGLYFGKFACIHTEMHI